MKRKDCRANRALDFIGNTGWRLTASFGGRPRCAFHVCLALTKCEKYALPATKMDS